MAFSPQHLNNCSFHFFPRSAPVSCSPLPECLHQLFSGFSAFTSPAEVGTPSPSLSQIFQDQILSLLNLGLSPSSQLPILVGLCTPSPTLSRGVSSPERCGFLPLYLISSPRSDAVLTQALNFLPRYLLEQRDVEVNVRDKWDSTPL